LTWYSKEKHNLKVPEKMRLKGIFGPRGRNYSRLQKIA
jgi:hypothetical protein